MAAICCAICKSEEVSGSGYDIGIGTRKDFLSDVTYARFNLCLRFCRNCWTKLTGIYLMEWEEVDNGLVEENPGPAEETLDNE